MPDDANTGGGRVVGSPAGRLGVYPARLTTKVRVARECRGSDYFGGSRHWRDLRIRAMPRSSSGASCPRIQGQGKRSEEKSVPVCNYFPLPLSSSLAPSFSVSDRADLYRSCGTLIYRMYRGNARLDCLKINCFRIRGDGQGERGRGRGERGELVRAIDLIPAESRINSTDVIRQRSN